MVSAKARNKIFWWVFASKKNSTVNKIVFLFIFDACSLKLYEFILMRLKSFFLLSLQIVISLIAVGQNTITTNSPVQTSFCAGGNLIVEYTSTGTFPLGCTFSAELSDGSGSFANPVTIGSMPINTGIIAGTIPSNTPFGFNYRVRVVANNPYTVGTTSTTPIIITSTAVTATIIANPSTEVCHGDTVSLWVTFNASYHWSTGETSQTIHVTNDGTYYVTVTNYLTGCEVTSDPMHITVHPTPVVNFGADKEVCAGQSITLNAGSGYSTYLWNDSSALQTLLVQHSGSYSVAVVDSFGCKGGDTVKVLFHNNPVVDLGPDTSLCGSALLISAGTGYAGYNWNNGLSFNPSLLVGSSGTYMVSVLDSNGCSDRDTIVVTIHPFPDITLGNDLSAFGSSITLDAGPGFSLYNWNNGQSFTRFFTVTGSGTYFIKITDQYGCSGSDTIKVTLVAPGWNDEFALFPNPFHDVLNIVSVLDLSGTVPVLYDMLGKYYYPQFSANSANMQINDGCLACGCYMLFLKKDDQLRQVGKVVFY